ncbi:MAG: hypothetical protein V3V67_10045 [Myxococcota bacterium]
MKPKIAVLILVLWSAGCATTPVTDEYDPRRAGHPLQVTRYVLYPAGVILDRLIFRPAWAVGHWGPLRELFGFELPPVELPPPTSPEAGEGGEEG